MAENLRRFVKSGPNSQSFKSYCDQLVVETLSGENSTNSVHPNLNHNGHLALFVKTDDNAIIGAAEFDGADLLIMLVENADEEVCIVHKDPFLLGK